MAWEEGPPESVKIHLRRWNGSRWEEIEASAQGDGLSRVGLRARQASCVADRKGNLHLAWYAQTTGPWQTYFLSTLAP